MILNRLRIIINVKKVKFLNHVSINLRKPTLK